MECSAEPGDQGSPGYYLIFVELIYEDPALDQDTRTRMLAWLIRKVLDIPGGPRFEVVPVSYLGPPYPATGLPAASVDGDADTGTEMGLEIEAYLKEYARGIEIAKLAEEAAAEPISWSEVLARFESAVPGA